MNRTLLKELYSGMTPIECIEGIKVLKSAQNDKMITNEEFSDLFHAHIDKYRAIPFIGMPNVHVNQWKNMSIENDPGQNVESHLSQKKSVPALKDAQKCSKKMVFYFFLRLIEIPGRG